MKHYIARLKMYRQLFSGLTFFYVIWGKFASASYKVEANYPEVKYPFKLRMKTTDIAAAEQVFLNDEYRFQLSKNPDTIIDAGANIGLTSIYFANKFPKAKIIAIEPEASNFELLLENISPYKNITAIRGALWDKNDSINVVDPGLGKWGFQTHEFVQNANEDTRQIVDGMTVDFLIEKLKCDHVDILKIDVEGAEKEIFENCESWIDSIGILIVELHDGEKTGCSRSFFNATNKFDLEWRNGENVYLVNNMYVNAGPLKKTMN